MQVNYDLLDTYPGGPYKSRGGYIKRTRYAPAEEDEEDEENEEGQVCTPSCAMITSPVVLLSVTFVQKPSPRQMWLEPPDGHDREKSEQRKRCFLSNFVSWAPNGWFHGYKGQ